jgi:Na+-driven multidrug efflux pump
MAAVMRAHLRAREVLVVMVFTHAVHLALAAVLMPLVGLAGYVLAVMAARLVQLVLHRSLWRERLDLTLVRGDWWRLKRPELAAMAHIGLPGAGENIAYRLSFMVSVAAAGWMGTQALATQAYVQQVINLGLLFGLSIGLAMETIVGHHVGAGRLRVAHRQVLRALALGLAISVAATVLMALAGPWVMRLFTQDPQIVAGAVLLLWWTVLLEPGRTFNLVVINALRAAGDARYPVIVGVCSMSIVLAGGSWVLGVEAGLGLVGVWIAYAADEWLRGLLMWRRWVLLAWVPQARKSRRRRF